MVAIVTLLVGALASGQSAISLEDPDGQHLIIKEVAISTSLGEEH